MKRLKRIFWIAAWMVAIGIILVQLSQLSREADRQKVAVSAAVADARATAAQEQAAAIEDAVAEAVAATEARIAAEKPEEPDYSKISVDTDEATQELFPDGSFLMEVEGDYRTASCRQRIDIVHWVRLQPGSRVRSQMERQEVNPLNVVVGVLTMGLTAFIGPSKPVQTIFAARTQGKYTTLILGALRDRWDDELVAPQVRLTLYRMDASTFGLVERVPIDEPAAAMPENGSPKFTRVLRRCAYVNGASMDLQ